MTGFIFYENGGLHTIHADLMLSAKVGENRELDFPTLPALIDKRYTDSILEYTPVSMMQKVVVVDPKTAYVWAGRESDAKKLHRIIEDHRKVGRLDPARSLDILVRESPDCISKFSAVVFSIYGENATQISKLNSEIFEFPALGNVMAGGRGEGEFFAVAAELISNIPDDLALEAYDRGDMEKHLSDMIVRQNLIDSLLQFRTFTDSFREAHTGGGIETATIANGIISKPDSTVYVIFVEDLFEEFGYSPRFILKRYYSNNFLGISLYDYFSGSSIHVTIPHPGNSHIAFRFSEEDKDPWKHTPQVVCCITVRKSGIVSHFHDSFDYFRDHFHLDAVSKRVVVSDWYRADMESKNRE